MSDTSKFSVSKRQKSTFEASVENVKIANDSISKAQNWLLVFGLAELSFLGTLLLSQKITNCSLVILVKFLLITLLASFVSFLIGSILQYRHLLKSARFYEEISNNAIEYLKRGIDELDNEPKDLVFVKEQIKSSKWTNNFFRCSFGLIFLSTIGIVYLIIKW